MLRQRSEQPCRLLCVLRRSKDPSSELRSQKVYGRIACYPLFILGDVACLKPSINLKRSPLHIDVAAHYLCEGSDASEHARALWRARARTFFLPPARSCGVVWNCARFAYAQCVLQGELQSIARPRSRRP